MNSTEQRILHAQGSKKNEGKRKSGKPEETHERDPENGERCRGGAEGGCRATGAGMHAAPNSHTLRMERSDGEAGTTPPTGEGDFVLLDAPRAQKAGRSGEAECG
jgi:hypothetical protein